MSEEIEWGEWEREWGRKPMVHAGVRCALVPLGFHPGDHNLGALIMKDHQKTLPWDLDLWVRRPIEREAEAEWSPSVGDLVRLKREPRWKAHAKWSGYVKAILEDGRHVHVNDSILSVSDVEPVPVGSASADPDPPVPHAHDLFTTCPRHECDSTEFDDEYEHCVKCRTMPFQMESWRRQIFEGEVEVTKMYRIWKGRTVGFANLATLSNFTGLFRGEPVFTATFRGVQVTPYATRELAIEGLWGKLKREVTVTGFAIDPMRVHVMDDDEEFIETESDAEDVDEDEDVDEGDEGGGFRAVLRRALAKHEAKYGAAKPAPKSSPVFSVGQRLHTPGAAGLLIESRWPCEENGFMYATRCPFFGGSGEHTEGELLERWLPSGELRREGAKDDELQRGMLEAADREEAQA